MQVISIHKWGSDTGQQERMFCRQTVWLRVIKSYYQLLKKCGAAERETQRWSGDRDILEQKIDYDKEMEHIANWITRHMKVLDRQLFNDPNGIKPSRVAAKESDDVYTLKE